MLLPNGFDLFYPWLGYEVIVVLLIVDGSVKLVMVCKGNQMVSCVVLCSSGNKSSQGN
jgi:hypothetical protein